MNGADTRMWRRSRSAIDPASHSQISWKAKGLGASASTSEISAAAMALIATPISSSDTVPVPARTADIRAAIPTAAPRMPASGSASAKAAASPL